MDVSELLNSLDQDTLILTANERLAAHLRRYYNQQQLQQHKVFWENPRIFSLQTWLIQTFTNDVHHELTLLNEYQEFAVWKSLIAKHQTIYWPNQLAYLTQEIKNAWKLLQDWCIPIETLKDYTQSNVQTFYFLAKKFMQHCKEQQWLDQNLLIPYITKNIHTQKISLPQKIILSGFLQPSPQISSLFDIFQKHCELINFDFYQSPKNIHTLAAKDESEEIRLAAHWAKQLLQHSKDLKIACIIPQLSEVRDNVQKIFNEVFSTKNFYLTTENQSFNISGGRKLNANPVIKFALTLLNLNAEEIDIHLVSYLLNSPFIAAAETELHERALLDEELRSLNEIILSLPVIMAYAKNQRRAPQLAKIIFKWLRWIKQLPLLAPMKTWCQHFIHLLNELGWPGQRSLNSAEYQIVQRFIELLTELCSTDFVQDQISQEEAFMLLQYYCENIHFQPETNDAPLQILGKLEAVGLNFDYLWVMGLDNQNFPPNPRLNPWLPADLQRNLLIPHATADAELHFYKILLKRYLTSAESIYLSYAQHRNDQEFEPSSLIEKFPSFKELCWSPSDSEAKLPLQNAAFEYLIDEKAMTLKPEEIIRGGSYLLKQQSLCPFSAFAKFRLQATSLPVPQPGLNSLERGILVHEVLMRFWQKIKNHQTLSQKTEDELDKIIFQCIDDSFINMIKLRPYTFKKRYMEIEKKRLHLLLKKWILIEKSRPPFTVVAMEEQRECQIKNLKLLLRVDRIDEISDGQQLIIDYKTGETNVADWLGEKPKEPQLPLYCVSSDTSIQGILFAQIRSKNMAFKGLSAGEIHIKGTHSSEWIELLQHWRESLEQLAEDYYNGHATTDPLEGDLTCQYCELQALCRIHEKELPV